MIVEVSPALLLAALSIPVLTGLLSGRWGAVASFLSVAGMVIAAALILGLVGVLSPAQVWLVLLALPAVSLLLASLLALGVSARRGITRLGLRRSY